MNKKKILIADDHPAIRRGVRNILSGEFPDAEFGEATDAAEAIQQLQSAAWDVVILDIDFPGRSGLDVLMNVREMHIKTPVLVFSFHREDQIAIRALRSGASGFLSKDAADTELISAVRQLMAGRKFIPPAISDQLIAQLQNPLQVPPHETLTGREYQTLLLIARGKTVSKIAEEMNLSVSTINTYRARMLKKMDMSTNAELTLYVIRNKLI
jgi:two-component system, NarL family, invasion response regulator UvrY